MIDSITSTEWLRLLLIYTHLLFSVLALARVLTCDLGLVTGKLSRQELVATAHAIVWLLLGLWASGLTVIWLDTGFDPAILAERSKLLFKLVSVFVLTVNGALIHHLAFPVLLSDKPLGTRDSILLCVTGSLSTLHWLLSAFVGVSGALARIPFHILFAGYAALCIAVVLGSIACMGLIRRHVINWRYASDPASHIESV